MKKDNFCDFLFVFYAPSPFCNGVHPEKKESVPEMLLSLQVCSFPFKVLGFGIVVFISYKRTIFTF